MLASKQIIKHSLLRLLPNQRLVSKTSFSSRCFSTQFSNRLLSNNNNTTTTTNTTTESNEEKTSSEPVVENSTSTEQQQPILDENSKIEPQTSPEQSTTSENGFNLQSTASLIMDSAESLKQKREMLQKELESRKDAEVMLKKIIYRGIRAFGVLFLAVCLLIWAVKRKNLEAKVKKFNDKIKKSEEKEQELERELEANFSYIKKDIESKNGTSSN